MRLLKIIKTTLSMWYEMRSNGYTLRDCYELSKDMHSRASSYLTWKRWVKKHEK